ncbi:hypothetical protein EAF00_007661 [Botryotinia globosa]|nr:hypothetical protein EAF00_007661 [Botryotinia globosa]
MLGYGQSKFRAENILNNAAKEYGIPVEVLRCGQIGGPAGDGKKQFVKWSNLVPGVKPLFGVAKEVSLQNWLRELKKHDATSKDKLQNFPALKLLGYFEWVANEERLFMMTENAQATSPSFRDLSPIDDEMIERWVKNWDF